MPGFAIEGDSIARSGFSTSSFTVNGDIAGTSDGTMPAPTEDYSVRYDYWLQRIYTNSLNQTHQPLKLFLGTRYSSVTYDANDPFEDSSETLSLDLPFASEFASLYPGETLSSVQYKFEMECRGFYLDGMSEEVYVSLGGFADASYTTIP